MTEMAVARVPESSAEERAPTGLPELDGMLEGGFLTGSLITLTGRPNGRGPSDLHPRPPGENRRRGLGMHDPPDHGRGDRQGSALDRRGRVRRRRRDQVQRPPGRRRAGPVHGDYEDAWNEPPDGSHPDRHRSSRDSNRPSACPRQARLGCGEAWRRGSWRSDGPCGGSDEPRFGTLMPPSLPGGTLRGRGEVAGCPPDHTPSCWTLTACIIRWVPPSGSSRERLAR